MVVSHDREFLDRVTTHTLDAAAGRPRLYLGGYTAYAERKAQRDEALDQQTEETRNAGREVAPEARLAPSRFRVEQKKGDKARAADRDQVVLQLTGIEVRRAAEGVEGTAVGVAAGAGSTEAEAVEAEAAAAEEEARVCIICEEAPREVRFACGHATVCAGCLPQVVERCRKCPTCDVAFGAQPVVEHGAHVRTAPTFVLPK